MPCFTGIDNVQLQSLVLKVDLLVFGYQLVIFVLSPQPQAPEHIHLKSETIDIMSTTK